MAIIFWSAVLFIPCVVPMPERLANAIMLVSGLFLLFNLCLQLEA